MRTRVSIISGLAIFLSLDATAQVRPALDTSKFVVMGEGLAAGMANYGLSSVVQQYSFPALMAAQMSATFPQPLIQPPGIGDVVGYPGQEVRLQTYPQGSVRQFVQPDPKIPPAPPLFVQNLSVPGLTLADSVSMRPIAPIAQRNMKQTVFNMLLGFPGLFLDNFPPWTQFEYAKAMAPTLALVELGYYEVLDAAVNGDLSRIPNPAVFADTYGNIVAGLRQLHAQVIVTTIPNPLDTGYFSTPATAAKITAAIPAVILIGYQLTPQDYISRNGLTAISSQFATQSIGPLPKGSILTAADAAKLTAAVNALNTQIVNVAGRSGAFVYDLNKYLHSVRGSGASVGSGQVTADYLGGFYSLDGIYPSPTGQALIANDVLKFVNSTFLKFFNPVNVPAIASSDPLSQVKLPRSQVHTLTSLGLPETAGASVE